MNWKGWIWILYGVIAVLAVSLIWGVYNKINKDSPATNNTTSQEETVVEKKTASGDSAKPTESQEKNESETQALNIDPKDIIETPLGDSMKYLAKHATKMTRTVTANGDGTYTETIEFQ